MPRVPADEVRRGHSHQSDSAGAKGGVDLVGEVRAASFRAASSVGLKLARMGNFFGTDGGGPASDSLASRRIAGGR